MSAQCPSLPPFALYSGFIYPLFTYEITDIVERYEPDYIMLTTDSSNTTIRRRNLQQIWGSTSCSGTSRIPSSPCLLMGDPDRRSSEKGAQGYRACDCLLPVGSENR